MLMQEKPHRKMFSICDEMCNVLIEPLSDIIESEVENCCFIGNEWAFIISDHIPLFLDVEDIYSYQATEVMNTLNRTSVIIGHILPTIHEFKMEAAPNSVFLTGANRGLGLEFVRQLLALPTPPKHLFASCRDPDSATELQAIAKCNSSLKVLKFDVRDLDMLPGICDMVAKEVDGEGLNMLINNAGILPLTPLEAVTEQGLMDTWKIITVCPMMITKAFLPLLKEAASKSQDNSLNYRRAMVVNVSSKLASISDNKKGGMYNYRMARAALNMGTNCLSIDLTPHGILAMLVHPGWVQTDMGGKDALITPAESISGMLALFATASEKHAGQLYDFKGNRIDW